MKFNEKLDITNYVGATLVRVVEDSEGIPLVNPTLEQLKEYLPGYTKDEGLEYTGDTKIYYGYTDTPADGGVRIIKQSDVDGGLAKEGEVGPQEVKSGKVTFIIEFDVESEVRVGEVLKTKTEKVKKLLTFRVNDAKNVWASNGEFFTRVFNELGQITNITEDGVLSSEKFEKDANTQPIYRTTNGLGFSELISFMYSYSSQTPGKYNLLGKGDDFAEAIDWSVVMDGDASAIQDRFIAIHQHIKKDNKPVYGSIVLFTVTNSASTNNLPIQTFYDTFSTGYGKGAKIDKELSYIKGRVKKSRKPSTKGKTYSPESEGVLVGQAGVVSYGVKEYKTQWHDFMDATSSGSSAGSEMFGGIPDLPADSNLNF